MFGPAAVVAACIVHTRVGQHGANLTSIEGLAAWLAGSFLLAIECDVLHDAVTDAVREVPGNDLGDLAAAAGLPAPLGMILSSARSASIDLASRIRADRDESSAFLVPVEAAMTRPEVPGEVGSRVAAEIDPRWRAAVHRNAIPAAMVCATTACAICGFVTNDVSPGTWTLASRFSSLLRPLGRYEAGSMKIRL